MIGIDFIGISGYSVGRALSAATLEMNCHLKGWQIKPEQILSQDVAIVSQKFVINDDGYEKIEWEYSASKSLLLTNLSTAQQTQVEAYLED